MVNNFIKLRGVRRKEPEYRNNLVIKASDTALLVVDIQEKLIKSIQNKEVILWNIKRLIDSSNLMEMNVYMTEQNPYKLGKTVDLIANENKYNVYSKMDFSCFNCRELRKDLKKYNIRNLIICGIETHVCILQTALDFICNGTKVYIPVDSIASRNTIDHETAIRRLEVSGATISTTEAAIFELCKSANTKIFKNISEIIKREKGYKVLEFGDKQP